MATWIPLIEDVRQSIHGAVMKTFEGPPVDYSSPPGDPGWFGPDSVTWRVYSDLPAMMAGGISALLLQTLHPLAMAGVARHSNFREDPLGRLRRTSAFVVKTTFGSTRMAQQSVRFVRRIHGFVNGTAPDGRRYDANDPALLTWVHCAEIISFLKSYQRYSMTPLTAAECDRYVVEVSIVARKLGAKKVPRNMSELYQYFRDVRPQLVATDEAFETVKFLFTHSPGKSPGEVLAYQIFVHAGVGLLPEWGREKLGLYQPLVVDLGVVRPALNALGATLRWAMGPSVVGEAARLRALAPRRPPRRRSVRAAKPKTAKRSLRAVG